MMFIYFSILWNCTVDSLKEIKWLDDSDGHPAPQKDHWTTHAQYMSWKFRKATIYSAVLHGQVLHYVRGQSDKRKRKDLLLSLDGDPFINRVLGQTILCFTYGGLL